jgi:hypothetical protein
MLLAACIPGFLNTGGASGASGNGILEGYVIGHGEAIYQLFTTTEKPDHAGLIATVGGAAAALVIGSLRLRFWWWPLHPVGYMLANLSWGMNRHYLQFLVGWAKTSVPAGAGSASPPHYAGRRRRDHRRPTELGGLGACLSGAQAVGVVL